MDLIASFGRHGASALGYILPFLFVLSIVVFFHELGHFLVGRLCGVKVIAFSVGFGPEIIGFNDRHGTRWKLSAIPLGGYVKFFGDANAASVPDWEKINLASPEERSYSFFHKSVAQRAAIIFAGPLANFVLAILIFAAIFSIYGKQTVTPEVAQVTASSAAEHAGIKPGDVIVAIDGQPIETFQQLQAIVGGSAGRVIGVTVHRGEESLTLEASPEAHAVPGSPTGEMRGTLGVVGTLRPQPENPIKAMWLGVEQTGQVVAQTFSFIGDVVSGHGDAKELGGPIKIAQISKEVADTGGLGGLIMLTAFISISIGLLNLFPIPLLDGGHLLFYAVEAIRGRPLGESTQEIAFRIGFALVMMLMVFAIWNDITNPFRG
jgi:regulator of sigma E protease